MQHLIYESIAYTPTSYFPEHTSLESVNKTGTCTIAAQKFPQSVETCLSSIFCTLWRGCQDIKCNPRNVGETVIIIENTHKEAIMIHWYE